MFKIIGIVVVVVIAGILIFAAMQPDKFHVSRQASIKAPAEKILPLITNLHGWTTWSPYEKKDPNMKRTFSGPESGKGAAYAWDGDKNVGAGSMEIVEVTPPTKVRFKLDFLRPMEGHHFATFTLEPRGESTIVEWALDGDMPFLSKVMCLFFNMDKMVGTDFEQGLTSLKALVEK
jgi:uncharacterized protein YndB with AHSA1/START domain